MVNGGGGKDDVDYEWLWLMVVIVNHIGGGVEWRLLVDGNDGGEFCDSDWQRVTR